MKNQINQLSTVLIIVFSLFLFKSRAQNIAITDDDNYDAHPSAMLDVKSLTKGMLVPRMTTEQREAIADPAPGLLVFDIDELNFYLFGGSDWTNLSTGNPSDLWSLSGSNVYLADPDNNLGIGSTTPVCKLEVKGDAGSGAEEPLFAVVNNAGDTVFAVYPEGVRIWVADAGSKASKGGFAVGGFSSAKDVTNDYLVVSPDSVRIYIDEDYTGGKASASKGGFAVGGFSSAKGLTEDQYLRVTTDSTRVNVKDSTAGFVISSIESGDQENFLDLTTQNYFIGHQTGLNNTTGEHNSFIGYQSGYSNTSGSDNSFIAYQAGYSNTEGDNNIFIGNRAGYNNTGGVNNTFVGFEAGYANTGQCQITAVGYMAGRNTASPLSVFIGGSAGSNAGGSNNTFVGHGAGGNATGGNNTFLGAGAGGGSGNIGGYNTFLGQNCGDMNTNGNNNVMSGFWCGRYNTEGSNNILLGNSAGRFNTTGNNNVIVGHQAAYGSFDNSVFNNNTILGYQAGYSNTTGSGNVFIGYQAGYNNTTGNNQLYIDNSNTSSPLIYGNFSSDYVTINGNLNAASTYFRITNNPGSGTIPTNYCYQGATGSASKQYAFSVYDAFWVTGRSWFDSYINIEVYDGPSLFIDGHEAIWLGADGTEDYFSWGYGGVHNRFADKVRIGGVDPGSYMLYVDGSAYCTGSWAGSDKRFKKNIITIDNSLDKIMNIKGRYYEFRTDEFKDMHFDQGRRTGFIAQEIMEVLPEVVTLNPDGYYALSYEGVIPVLVEAMKEQQEIIENLKKDNEKYKNKVDNLSAEIKTIKEILEVSSQK